VSFLYMAPVASILEVPGIVLTAKVSLPTCILILMSGQRVEASLAHVSTCPWGVVVLVFVTL
jgi:hypothetical protein